MSGRISLARHAFALGLIASFAVLTAGGSIATAAEPVVVAAPAAAQVGAAQLGALKIVVIEGEDAVNIIQQKTAVAPVVEVRDRNDQPVAGAVVTFAIRGGRATFNGARTLTLTTNAAGRAAVTGLTPTGSGALQISASAAFQGQTAVATIAQTNVMTAAQAASVGAGGSSSGAGAGGAGGGSGGGLSTTTLGVIGGAAAGGVLVATKVAGGDSGEAGSGGSGAGAGGSGASGGGTSGGGGGTAAPTSVTVTGPFTGQFVDSWRYSDISLTCSLTRGVTGTVKMTLQLQSGGAVTGTLEQTLTASAGAITCSEGFSIGAPGTFPAQTITGPVTGTSNSLVFNQVISNNTGGFVTSFTYTFSGTLNNGVVTGTLGEILAYGGPLGDGAGSANGGGSVAMPVTLR